MPMSCLELFFGGVEILLALGAVLSGFFRAGWPIQAVLWLEWGSSITRHGLPTARRVFAVHTDSISTRSSQTIA